MKLFLVKTDKGFLPYDDSDVEKNNKLKAHDVLECETTRPRNVRFLKKYFALLKTCFDNQDEYDNMRAFRYVVTLKSGYFTTIQTDKGIVFMPDSISFASMDDIEFEKLYSKTIDVLLKMVAIDRQDLENEIINFM